MNEEDKSNCYTEKHFKCESYKVPCDSEGNNIVTGEGSKKEGNDKRFTCIDIEVFSVI